MCTTACNIDSLLWLPSWTDWHQRIHHLPDVLYPNVWVGGGGRGICGTFLQPLTYPLYLMLFKTVSMLLWNAHIGLIHSLTLSPADPSSPGWPLSPYRNRDQKMSLFYLHLSDKVIFLTFSLPCYQFPLEARGDPERCDQIRQNTSSSLFWPTRSIFTKKATGMAAIVYWHMVKQTTVSRT